MTFGAALSLLSPVSALPLSGPRPIFLPAGLAHDLWIQGCGALLSPPVGGMVSSVFPLPVCRSVSQLVGLLFVFASCWRVKPSRVVSLLLPPSLAFIYISAPTTWKIWNQNTAKSRNSVLAVCWAECGSWQCGGMLSYMTTGGKLRLFLIKEEVM